MYLQNARFAPLIQPLQVLHPPKAIFKQTLEVYLGNQIRRVYPRNKLPECKLAVCHSKVERLPRMLLLENTNQHVPTLADRCLAVKQNKTDSVLERMTRLGKKANKFAHGIREHVRLGTKVTETVKGKLSLGARILQVGGVKKVFRKLFTVREGERLLKACQCYLSTTAGPIAGLLFVSTDKIAFCSERSIKLSSPDGKFARIHYKVTIPLTKIKNANQSKNLKKPTEKYIEVVTVDDFNFWFMGFLNFQKALNYIQQATAHAWMSSSH